MQVRSSFRRFKEYRLQVGEFVGGLITATPSKPIKGPYPAPTSIRDPAKIISNHETSDSVKRLSYLGSCPHCGIKPRLVHLLVSDTDVQLVRICA